MPQPCGLGQYYKTLLHLHISPDHTQVRMFEVCQIECLPLQVECE